MGRSQKLPQKLAAAAVGDRPRRSSYSRNRPDAGPLIHAEPLSDTFVATNEAQNPGGANMFEGMIIMGLYIIALVNLDKINGT